jgi:excisionase family DNA binding protein
MRLGVPLRTLYRLIDEGHLPAYKTGRIIRLKVSDVEAFDGPLPPDSSEHQFPLDRPDGPSGVREPRRPRPSGPSGQTSLTAPR